MITKHKFRFQHLTRLSLALAVIALPLIAPFTAYATSAYDNVYHETDEMWLAGKNQTYGNCVLDIASNWSSYITDSANWLTGSDFTNARAAFTTALSSGDWAVSNRFNGYPDTYSSSVWVWFSTSNNLKMFWSQYGTSLDTTDNTSYYEVRIEPRSTVNGVCVGKLTNVNMVTDPSVLNSTSTPFSLTPSGTNFNNNTSALLTNITDYNYPTGYAGLIPRNSYSPKQFWFSFRTQIDNQQLKVLPNDTDNEPGCFLYRTSIYQGDGDSVDDWEQIELYSLPVGRDIEKVYEDLPYADNYHLAVATENCPPPYTDTLYDGGMHNIQVVDFKIDGSAYTLDTRDMNCADGMGFCTAPTELEDCTTFGTDVVGGFGCVMRNFIQLLKNLFTFMFVPSPYLIQGIFGQFTDFFNGKFGFLTYPFVFISDFFAGITGGGDDCEQNFAGNFFGANGISLNLCTAITPAYEALVRVIVSTATVVGLIFAYHRKYMDIIRK